AALAGDFALTFRVHRGESSLGNTGAASGLTFGHFGCSFRRRWRLRKRTQPRRGGSEKGLKPCSAARLDKTEPRGLRRVQRGSECSIQELSSCRHATTRAPMRAARQRRRTSSRTAPPLASVLRAPPTRFWPPGPGHAPDVRPCEK